MRDNGNSVLKDESHHTEFIHELPEKSGRSYCLLRPCEERKTIASRRNWSKACKGLETQLKYPGQYILLLSLCLWGQSLGPGKVPGRSKLERRLLWDFAVFSLSFQVPELQAGLVSGSQTVVWMSPL